MYGLNCEKYTGFDSSIYLSKWTDAVSIVWAVELLTGKFFEVIANTS